jgi:hypothetical protein
MEKEYILTVVINGEVEKIIEGLEQIQIFVKNESGSKG